MTVGTPDGANITVKQGTGENVTVVYHWKVASSDFKITSASYEVKDTAGIPHAFVQLGPGELPIPIPAFGDVKSVSTAIGPLKCLSQLLLLLAAVAVAPKSARNSVVAIVLLAGFVMAVNCPTVQVVVLVPPGCTYSERATTAVSTSLLLKCPPVGADAECGASETMFVVAGKSSLAEQYLANGIGSDPKECTQMCLGASFTSAANALGLRATSCKAEGFGVFLESKNVDIPAPLDDTFFIHVFGQGNATNATNAKSP